MALVVMAQGAVVSCSGGPEVVQHLGLFVSKVASTRTLDQETRQNFHCDM